MKLDSNSAVFLNWIYSNSRRNGNECKSGFLPWCWYGPEDIRSASESATRWAWCAAEGGANPGGRNGRCGPKAVKAVNGWPVLIKQNFISFDIFNEQVPPVGLAVKNYAEKKSGNFFFLKFECLGWEEGTFGSAKRCQMSGTYGFCCAVPSVHRRSLWWLSCRWSPAAAMCTP